MKTFLNAMVIDLLQFVIKGLSRLQDVIQKEYIVQEKDKEWVRFKVNCRLDFTLCAFVFCFVFVFLFLFRAQNEPAKLGRILRGSQRTIT